MQIGNPLKSINFPNQYSNYSHNISSLGDSYVQKQSKLFDVYEVGRVGSVPQTLPKKIELLLHLFSEAIAFTIIRTCRVAALSTAAHFHPNFTVSIDFARGIDFEFQIIAFVTERH
jgi:hypothetical protein